MQRTSRPEGLDLPSPQLPRNHSSFSDRTPSISGSSLLSPPSIAPSPAYIAASAASQIVNSNRVDLGQESAEEPRGDTAIDTAVFTPGSLSLVNTFLDQLLFSFLASSRSTSIASLRPAILEVLKPRLGKEVIDGADEELQGYLAGGDAEELLAFHSGQEFKGEYNLNLVWRRTRLRCMVYTRLGDMEEEDEDTYLEQEQEASANDGQARLTRDLGSVSPAAAIFLTSILEFIGEKVLIVAGEAACTRIKMQQSSDGDQRPVVEEVDVEKLAFNTTLGRLWRSWKKRVRSSSLLTPRPMSRDTLDHRANSLSPAESMNRKPSAVDEYGSGYFDPAQRPSVAKVLGNGHVSGPNTREVAENLPEEPDFSDFSMEPPSPEVSKSQRGRPRSMIDYRKAPSESPVQRPTQSQAPNDSNLSGVDGRPKQKRQRSSSVPAKQTPYVSPTDETFTTPSEGPDPFVRNGDRFDAEQAMPKLTDDSKNVPDLANGNHAVSTMYDGAINHDAEVLPESMAERNNRGISTYTESSNQTDEYDHEMAPQALKLHKPAENVAKQPRDSQASTYSSNYSFQAGEFTPVGHFNDPVNNPLEKGAEADNAANLGNGGPIGQVHADSDRQHTEHASGFSALPDNHFHTSNDGRGAAKRDVSVLQEASSDGEVKSIAEPVLCARAGMQDEGEIDTTAKSNHTVVGSSQGVPALSPLRELMNDAHDTSDEASSSAPSHDTSKRDAFVPTHRYRGSATGSISSSMFNQTPPLTTAGKVADLRPQPTANTGAEKAAVQRVSSRRSTTGRASASSIREGRPLTANSTTSQMSSKIKGMIGRESGDLVRQPMPKRNSSDNSESLVRTPNKEQDFEELIKSDETVKYTLTPQNMREMEVCSPFVAIRARALTLQDA